MPALAATEVPDVTELEMYAVVGHAIFIGALVLVILTVTVIFKTSSRSMSTYRFYLVNEMVWGLFMDLCFSFFTPVVLLPVPCVITTVGSFSGNQILIFALFFLIFLAGRLLALLLLFMYRFLQSLPPDSRLTKFRLENAPPEKVAIAYGIAILTVAICISTPFFLRLTDQATHRTLLVAADPSLAAIFDRFPTVFCISSEPSLPKTSIFPYCACLVAIVLAYVAAASVMHANIRRIRHVERTYRLQLMLFWSLIAQIASTVVFLVLPSIVLAIGRASGLRNIPRYTMGSIFVIMCHMYVDCLLVMVFIKPYRRFLASSCLKLRITSVTQFSSTAKPLTSQQQLKLPSVTS